MKFPVYRRANYTGISLFSFRLNETDKNLEDSSILINGKYKMENHCRTIEKEDGSIKWGGGLALIYPSRWKEVTGGPLISDQYMVTMEIG